MNNNTIQVEKEMSKREIRKSIIMFSGPIVAELMLMSLINIVNLSMVGHLGAYAISSVGLTNQPVFISIAVFQSLNVGATALISRFIGAQDYKEVKAVVVQTMILSIIIGVVLSIIGFIFSRQIVLLMGAQTDTVESASMFMRYMAIGMLLQSVPTAVASILRGAGESKVPMKFNIVSNIVNAAAGIVLIYGLPIFPGLGLQGAAIASTLAKLTACIMSVYALMKCGLPVAISLQDNYRLDIKVIKRILNIGISTAGEQFAMRLGFLLYTRIIADLGTVSLAAHQICLSITALASNVMSGLSIAASSFTGRSLGADKPDLAEEYCTEIRRIGLMVSISMGVSFFFAGHQISRIFTSDKSVLALSANVLKIAAFITFPQNSLMIISGGLRGAGDTKWPLVSSLAGTVVGRITMAIIFVKVFHLGLGGAWSAALLDQSIRSVLLHFRFKAGKWKHISV